MYTGQLSGSATSEGALHFSVAAVFDGINGLTSGEATFEYASHAFLVYGTASYLPCEDSSYRSAGSLAVRFLDLFDGGIPKKKNSNLGLRDFWSPSIPSVKSFIWPFQDVDGSGSFVYYGDCSDDALRWALEGDFAARIFYFTWNLFLLVILCLFIPFSFSNWFC